MQRSTYRSSLTSGNRCYFLRGPRCLKSFISLLPLHAGTSLSAVAQRQPCHQNLDNSSSVSAPALPDAIFVQYLPACASMHANGLLLGQPQACDDLQSLQGKPSCRQLRISVGNSFCLAVDPGLSEIALKSLTRFPYLDFLITGGGLPGTRMNIVERW